MRRRWILRCAVVVVLLVVAGVALVGGPAPTVRGALRQAGQALVEEPGVGPLCDAVERALGPQLNELGRRSRRAGEDLRWPAVIHRWESAMKRAL